RQIPDARARLEPRHRRPFDGRIRRHQTGMKHPDIYSVVYGINPAVLGWAEDLSADNPAFSFLSTNKPKTPDEVSKGGFYAFGIVIVGQAFSPNPTRAGLFIDLAVEIVNGKVQ